MAVRIAIQTLLLPADVSEWLALKCAADQHGIHETIVRILQQAKKAEEQAAAAEK